MRKATEPVAAPAPLSRLDVLRGLRVSTWEGVWATVWAVLTTGAFQTGFALELGASPFVLGVLAGLPAVVGLLQLPASLHAERGAARKPFIARAAITGRLLWLPILALPFFLPFGWQLPAFIVLLAVSSALMTITVPAWTSWMSDLVPAGSRGQYFGQRNMVCGIVTMLVPLPAGAFLDQALKYDRFPARVGFAVLFALACLAAIGALVMLRRQPEPPHEAPRKAENPLRLLQTPLADRNFRRYLLFAGVLVFGQTLAGQFFTTWQVGKNALNLSYLTVQILGAVTAAAGLASTPFWGYLGDKFGSRPLLAIGAAGVIVAPILWVFTTPGALYLNIALIILVNIFSGVFWSGVGLAQFNLLLGMANPSARSTYVAVYSAYTGVIGGVSPILGGIFMSALAPVAFELGPVVFNNYKLLFLLVALIRIVAFFLLGGVYEDEGRSARYVLEQITRAQPVTSLRSLRRLSRPADAATRLQAVEELEHLRAPLAVEELARALDDVSSEVRESAAHALGVIGDARAIPFLAEKLGDRASGVGEIAAQALGRIGNAEAAPALAQAARGQDAGVRVAALRALAHLGTPAEPLPSDAIAALVDALDPAHPTACEAACLALASRGGSFPPGAAQEIVPRLLRLLSPSTQRGTRFSAARALDAFAPEAARIPDAYETLRAALETETDGATLAQEAVALGRLGRAAKTPPTELLAALLPLLRHPALGGLAYKQTLEAVADMGLGAEAFYPYLGITEMARDEIISRVITELRRHRRVGKNREKTTTFLEAYSAGDYARGLETLAALAPPVATTPAALVLHALSRAAQNDPPAARAEEVLLGVLLLREVLG